MKTVNLVEEIFNEVVTAGGAKIKPLGFRQRGAAFQKIVENNSGIISFQRSRSSTRHKLTFTVNLGVICGALLDERQPKLSQVGVFDAHIQERIGYLLPEHSDKWWEVTESSDRFVIAEELSNMILSEGVPFIERYLSTKSIIELWESGKSPGLTDYERLKLLSQLKEK